MSRSIDKRQYLRPIALDTINTFEAICDAVADRMRREAGPSHTSIANAQTFTSGAAHNQLEGILRSEQANLAKLAREPAISRIVAVDAEGNCRIYFICRNAPVTLPGRTAPLASYKSKMGRLASLPIGEEVEIEIDGIRQGWELVERCRLQPIRPGGDWDSQNTIVEGGRIGIATVESLRALLDEGAREDLVDAILAEEQGAAGVRGGIRRSVITKMELRDQPILDQLQDDIFRSPLDSRLFVLGPPGAGKTTTLIRRLGQKLDLEYLEQAEAGLVERATQRSGLDHSQSWLMFSPTELLKQYVKEAFALEQIPASDQRHMKTWADHRHYLARNVFGVLRSASGQGYFILRDDLSILKKSTVHYLIDWHDDFADFHAQRVLEQLHRGLEALQHRINDRTERIAERVAGLLEGAMGSDLPELCGRLESLHGDIAPILKELKVESDRRIREVLNLQLNADRSFLHEFAGFLDSLGSDDVDNGEDDAFDEDDDTPEVSPRTPISKAVTTHLRFIKALSRTRVQKRQFGRGSRNARILEWLGGRIPGDAELAAVGQNVLLQNCLRRFVNMHKKFVHDVGRSYRSYRKQGLGYKHWYTAEARDSRSLSALEIDLILLVMVRNARALLSDGNIATRIDEPRFGYLRDISAEFRNQVVVDEATDFSCIQLACMAHLTHPSLESFFACGDFNQRVTEWGCRSIEQLGWAVPGIVTRAINISYRQTRQLNEFSNRLVADVSGGSADVALPEAMENDGVAPALLENASDRSELCRWLAGRFAEIEEFVERLPSIAVLVQREAQVQPLADALNPSLTPTKRTS